MANTPSSKKRARQNEKRRVHNQSIRNRAKTFVKRARQAIDAGDLEEAEERVRIAASELDRAASKGVIHQNNAARRKSRLMKKLHKEKQEA